MDDDRPQAPVKAASAAKAPTARVIALMLVVATVGQLLLATVATGLHFSGAQFSGKGFGARLVAYPVLMLILPALWALRRRLRRETGPLP